jgi:hypothetical protein
MSPDVRYQFCARTESHAASDLEQQRGGWQQEQRGVGAQLTNGHQSFVGQDESSDAVHRPQ